MQNICKNSITDYYLDLAEGVRNTTTVFDSEGLDRVRLTRFIGTDGIVRPYSQREALGQFWLKTTDNGRYFNEDYIAHLELPGRDMLVLLTYNQIMLVRTKKLETEWDIRLTDIQTISKERTGMSITLKGGANGPFIPVQDESSRNWVYRQIAVGKQDSITPFPFRLYFMQYANILFFQLSTRSMRNTITHELEQEPQTS